MPNILPNSAFNMKTTFFVLSPLPNNNAFLLTRGFKACFLCMLELFSPLGVFTCAENLFLLRILLSEISLEYGDVDCNNIFLFHLYPVLSTGFLLN